MEKEGDGGRVPPVVVGGFSGKGRWRDIQIFSSMMRVVFFLHALPQAAGEPRADYPDSEAPLLCPTTPLPGYLNELNSHPSPRPSFDIKIFLSR